VKAILAVAADGERYRPGHYGAITKVRARGNVTGNGNLTILVAESHEAEMQSVAFSLAAFSGSRFCGDLAARGRGLGRLERLTGR
jgi:hypothetical protein